VQGTVNGVLSIVSTYYVRDASGNVMSIYTSGVPTVNSSHLTQSEIDLYGSSRLGVYNVSNDVQNCNVSIDSITNFIRGNKFFELSNHLGNVLVTVSDRKLSVDSNNDGVVDYYTANVVTANDYYPFGMVENDRQFSQPNSSFRYGFNDKENDNDIENGAQDYGMRINDVRLGRFLSIDPITKKYPELTPYQFASNTPIWGVDIDGLEVKIYTETKGTGHTFLTVGSGKDLTLYTYGRYGGGDWYTAGTTGPGVLIKYTGAEASNYIKTELYQNQVKVFEVSGVKDNDVKSTLDTKYNSSTAVPDSKSGDIREYGHVIDTYSLFGNNCTTTSCDALKDAGADIFNIETPLYSYDEDFTIPSSLQDYLIEKSQQKNSNVTDVTDETKIEYPNDANKKTLGSAGSSGETSGASGSSAGASANTSSTDASSSGNGSGSFGSGSGSSSSQDVDPVTPKAAPKSAPKVDPKATPKTDPN